MEKIQTGSKWQYDVSELGFKYNITDLAASYGLWQFKFLQDWSEKRRKIFELYKSKLSSIDGLICPNEVKHNEIDAYHLFIIKIKPNEWSISRNDIIEKLNLNGIGTSVHYVPVHMHSYYAKKYDYEPNYFPMANNLSKNVISLPIYPSLRKEELNYIIDTISKLWNKYKI